MPRRVTMADVAREAGVSVMTVSRVVNGKDGISAATRQRIQTIIDRLGYRPSEIARGLVTQRTATLGLVVPDNANPFFSEVARGVEHLAYDAGYNVILCNTDEDVAREVSVLRLLEEKRVDGVVLCSPRLQDAELRDALTYHPAVMLINRPLPDSHFDHLMIDDELGGRLATAHLLSRGHTRIGFLAGPEASSSGRRRQAGYRAALQEAGITPDAAWVRHCAPTVEGGKEAAHHLLNAQPALTALFCYNDLTAIGTLIACREAGRRVPEDLAVVGYDDIPMAALITPPLTTCHVPRYEIGRQATRLLLDRVATRTDSAIYNGADVVITPELVIRASAP